MQDRSISVMTLSVGSAVVGLYCQLAAVALLASGSTFFTTGSPQRALVLALGLGFFAITMASYAMACGFWARKRWSRPVGLAAFGGLIVASLALGLLSTNLISALLPTVSAMAGIWMLNKPAVRAELDGAVATVHATVPVGETMGVAGQVR